MGKPTNKIERSLTGRRRNLCRAMDLAYGSAKSHFIYVIKKGAWYEGDLHFNAKTIREYAEIILICAVELECLARKAKRPLTVKPRQTKGSKPA